MCVDGRQFIIYFWIIFLDEQRRMDSLSDEQRQMDSLSDEPKIIPKATSYDELRRLNREKYSTENDIYKILSPDDRGASSSRKTSEILRRSNARRAPRPIVNEFDE